jgi:predicted RNA-binding Zn ribbon-like protein
MAIELVPGAAFRLVGGRPCLDFINTASWEGPGSAVLVKERLVGFDDLVRFGVAAGLLARARAAALARAGAAAEAKATVVVRARVLRTALIRVFTAAIASRRPGTADLVVLNAELARAGARERLAPRAGILAWEWETGAEALDRVLWPVARSAGELLTSRDLTRVRQCAGPDCGWLFLDASRNHSRRWCDMADCGNLAKVRRFRRRGR